MGWAENYFAVLGWVADDFALAIRDDANTIWRWPKTATAGIAGWIAFSLTGPARLSPRLLSMPFG
jgi:hypothetical protein